MVVLEREGGPRQEGSAITFWPNAFRVLDALGVAAPVRETHALVERCASVLGRCAHTLEYPGKQQRTRQKGFALPVSGNARADQMTWKHAVASDHRV